MDPETSSSSSSPNAAPEEEDNTNNTDGETLIPGLPNDLSSVILSLLPLPHAHRLQSTSKSWRSFLSLRQSLPFPLPDLLCIFPQDPSLSPPLLFDPSSPAWLPLPLLPADPNVYSLCNFSSLSLPPFLFLLGGSLFDARSFPLDRPSPSPSVFRLDLSLSLSLSTSRWAPVAPMITPRGSFACAARGNRVFVAGGGSRHTLFGAAGSRISSVEGYDVCGDRWEEVEAMPRFRAGCVGFWGKGGREFWVMGGYGESRTVNRVFPVDEYYRDAVVLEFEGGRGRWREVGDMWERGERRQLGKIAVIYEEDEEDDPHVFMLDDHHIFRYNMAFNRWLEETSVPRRAAEDSSYGFVALNGELHIMTLLHEVDSSEIRRSKLHRRLYIQIYHPRKLTWRFLITKPPFNGSLDFRTAVMCTVRV